MPLNGPRVSASEKEGPGQVRVEAGKALAKHVVGKLVSGTTAEGEERQRSEWGLGNTCPSSVPEAQRLNRTEGCFGLKHWALPSQGGLSPARAPGSRDPAWKMRGRGRRAPYPYRRPRVRACRGPLCAPPGPRPAPPLSSPGWPLSPRLDTGSSHHADPAAWCAPLGSSLRKTLPLQPRRGQPGTSPSQPRFPDP